MTQSWAARISLQQGDPKVLNCSKDSNPLLPALNPKGSQLSCGRWGLCVAPSTKIPQLQYGDWPPGLLTGMLIMAPLKIVKYMTVRCACQDAALFAEHKAWDCKPPPGMSAKQADDTRMQVPRLGFQTSTPWVCTFPAWQWLEKRRRTSA